MSYKLLLFVHVLGVIAWVGAGFAFQFTSERARTRESAAAIARFSALFGKHYFMIASIVVLAAGIGMVLEGDIRFTEPFVVGGLTGVVLSSIVGGAIIGKTADRLTSAIDGGSDQEVMGHMAKLRTAGRIDLTIMLVVIYLMTVKPGT